jgi:hypothetical protein
MSKETEKKRKTKFRGKKEKGKGQKGKLMSVGKRRKGEGIDGLTPCPFSGDEDSIRKAPRHSA